MPCKIISKESFISSLTIELAVGLLSSIGRTLKISRSSIHQAIKTYSIGPDRAREEKMSFDNKKTRRF